MASLDQYPSPHVAVDVAVLTIAEPGTPGAHLATLVLDSTTSSAGKVVPGRFLREGETSHDCIAITLREKASLSAGDIKPRLLRVFDAPDRDPRGWTISLGHVVVLPRVAGRLVPVNSLPRMLFDHDVIVAEAVANTQARYEAAPDPDSLMTATFTLSELRALHEAVLGERVRRDTFRRRMEPQLEPHMAEGRQASRTDGGRPARLWRAASIAPERDHRLRLPRSTD